MVNVNQVFSSEGKHMKAEDLGGKIYTLTMGHAKPIQFDDGNKIELEFQGAKKTLVLNKTNASTIAAMFGPDTEAWFGHKLEVYPDTTMFGDKLVPCIRVRAPLQHAGGAAPATAQPGWTPPVQPTEAPPGPSLDDDIPF